MKALMKVHAYIEWLIESGILTIAFEVFPGAIASYVPSVMVHCIHQQIQ